MVDLDRTDDKRDIFPKVHTTNWSYEIYSISQVFPETVPDCPNFFYQRHKMNHSWEKRNGQGKKMKVPRKN